ncbi:speckle-type POZ protein-like isoform X1 [Ornithodoros turicata]|uniref:speckle-type POZ protein-like isoform X1 n=1 Tax=Ornithodoros turicata TaxID=34597 RepID=UPI0031397DCE
MPFCEYSSWPSEPWHNPIYCVILPEDNEHSVPGIGSDVLTHTYSCRRLKRETCVHTWVIEDFSLRLGSRDDFVESDKFSPDADSEWCLRLYPWSKDNFYDTVFLELVFLGTGTAVAKGQFWIVSGNGRTVRKCDMLIRKFTPEIDAFSVWLGEKKDFLDTAKGLLVDDVLTLSCELTTVKDTGISMACTLRKPLEGPTLKDDVSRFSENTDFTDLTIVAENKTFRVHKVLLAARSPVFHAMFMNDMKEKQESLVEVKDLSADVVREMLTFVYTDEAPNLCSMACDLLQAADKYDLERLRSMCEEQIALCLTADTAVDALRLADRTNAAHLKRVATHYINTHADDVRKSDGWEAMIEEEPHLLECIYSAMFEEKVSIKPEEGWE